MLVRFKNNSLVFFIFMICLHISSKQSHAQEPLPPNVAIHHYQLGYEAQSKRNYGFCADEFYIATNTEDPKIRNQARLGLIYCQVKLKLRKLAVYHLNQIDEDELSKSELVTYQKLSEKLSAELAELHSIHGNLSVYGILSSFNPKDALKKSLSGLGVVGNFYRDGWSIFLALENIKLLLNSIYVPSYYQTQYMTAIGRNLTSSWTLRGNFTYIASYLASPAPVRIFGASTSYEIFSRLYLTVDYQNSDYTSLSWGPMSVQQWSASILKKIFLDDDNFLLFEILGQTQSTNATGRYDNFNQFKVSPTYTRVSLQSTLKLQSWLFAFGGWKGTEAFGVRNQGALVFNAVEKHLFGVNSKIGCFLSEQWYSEIIGNIEGYEANGKSNLSNTAALTLSLNF